MKKRSEDSHKMNIFKIVLFLGFIGLNSWFWLVDPSAVSQVYETKDQIIEKKAKIKDLEEKIAVNVSPDAQKKNEDLKKEEQEEEKKKETTSKLLDVIKKENETLEKENESLRTAEELPVQETQKKYDFIKEFQEKKAVTQKDYTRADFEGKVGEDKNE